MNFVNISPISNKYRNPTAVTGKVAISIAIARIGALSTSIG